MTRTRSHIHIERRDPRPLQDAELVRAALEAARLAEQPVTAARVAGLTGLPLDHAADALTTLAATRRCAIGSDDAGELRYRFASLAAGSGGVVHGRFERLFGRVEPLISVLFVLAIIAILLMITAGGAYLTAYVTMHEGAPTPLRAVSGLISGALFLATAILFGLPALPLYLLSQVPAQAAAPDGSPVIFGGFALASGFGMCVYGWIIGERLLAGLRDLLGRLYALGGPRRGPLYDERRFLTLTRARGGRVRTADLVGLFGWTVDQARAEVTRLLVSYGGDIEVDDDAIIWFTFEGFAGEQAVGAPAPIWEAESWRPRRYDDSSAGAGYEAMAMQLGAAFGLCALGAISWVEPRFNALDQVFSVPRWVVDGSWWLLFGSMALSLPPLWARALLVASRDRAWDARRRWHLLLEQAVGAPQGVELPADTPTAWLSDLGAQIDVERGGEGTLWVSFPEL